MRRPRSVVNLMDGEAIDRETKTVCFLPILQSTPATVGVAGSQTVTAALPLVALCHFHPEHLHIHTF